MPITPTNQSKNTITPTGQVKTFSIQGVYGIGLYGYAIYGVGIANYGNATNQTKSSSATIFLITDEDDFLITDEGDYLVTAVGGQVTNQSKS